MTARKRGPVTIYPRPCLGPCGRTIRPSRTSKEDYPDTVSLDGLGRCRACRNLIGQNGHARDAENTKTTEQNRAGLERFLAGRRPSKTVKVVRL